MNYQQMFPVVDEWVLWLLCLLTPLVALCALTAFIVLHRERNTATPEKHRLNLIMASSAGLLTLFILAFMLFSGLRIEANKANASENIKAKYDISSVTWKTPDGREVSPTDTSREVVVMVTDHNNRVSTFAYHADNATSEPYLEMPTKNYLDDYFQETSPENLLKK